MRPKNWDRLLYNLSFSNAVVLYTDIQEPLIRYLSDIQDEYHLSYIPSLKDLTDKALLTTVFKQLTDSSSVIIDKPLKYLLDEQDQNDNCYTVAVKGLPTEPVINQLLDCMQYFAGRFNVIFEITPVQASLFSQNYPSQVVSLIGPDSAEQAHSSPLEHSVNPAEEARNSTKKSYLIWLSLTMLCLLFTLGIWWFLSQNDIDSNLKPNVNLAEPENLGQTESTKFEIEPLAKPKSEVLTEPQVAKSTKELDLVEQAILQKDMTAAEYFAAKKKNQQAEITDKTKSNLAEQAPQPESLIEAKKYDQQVDIGQQPVKKPETAETDLKMDNKPAITQQNEQQAEPNLGYYDNLWYQQQNPKQYVIQLTLVSSESVLDEFLASPDIQTLAEPAKLKVYESEQRFGVTYGIYPTHQTALAAINTLPGSIKNAGAFAKPVAAIAQLIAKKK
ncbi:SPOR domain-containing protein [Catenovulum adriaticum]|uniref:SPOR domain-containing protein n=1 Tax=Catenovulum adriaticum TaxID=2984846 RepID=A0ABY7AM87_9ALTE|nr:hypothetical protein [Catenovulum sp. TS8]WAJ70266.1 hypothetical protein OLW01_00130 [Catenovulum sp. TS8]